jgi:putative Holliday junction resolvase
VRTEVFLSVSAVDLKTGLRRYSDLMMSRLLAIDVGEKRIGVAISDETLTLARPLLTVTRGSKVEDFQKLKSVCDQYQIDKIICGLPKTLRNEIGPQARRVQRYADELAAAIELPIEFWDERFSSVEAEERLAASSRKKRAKGDIDSAAAAIILQEYLDSMRNDQ